MSGFIIWLQKIFLFWDAIHTISISPKEYCIVTYLRELFSDVSPYKHSLQVDPEVLDRHPVLYDISCVGQILHPLLYLCLKWGVVPVEGVAPTYILTV